MPCLSSTIRVVVIVFDGINFTPITKSAKIKLGGLVDDGGETNVAGEYFGSHKMEPAEVEFDYSSTNYFNPDTVRGRCGDLQVITAEGYSYLVTNARLATSIELTDGDGKFKLAFRGDAAKIF